MPVSTVPALPALPRPQPVAARPPRAALTVAVVTVVVLGLFGAVALVVFRAPARPAPALTARILVPGDVPGRGAVAAQPAAPARPAVAADAGAAEWRIGDWTPARGREIAERALRWVGWPYSFGGGDAAGPTYGVAVDEASRHDGQVRGFDCSGLVLYALAPWLRVEHLASAQYLQTGSLHPSLRTLLPGDLVFWSTDGTIGAVHHVAVYIGGGRVVQAPASGQLISVTPLGAVAAGTIGTVRPLT